MASEGLNKVQLIGDDTTPNKTLCHRCNRVTRWLPTRKGARRLKCEECGDVYPCRHDCKHLECKFERSRWRNPTRTELTVDGTKIVASARLDP